MKSGKIEDYKHLSKFKSTKEFNTHIEKWMADHKNKFTKGELIGLKRLIRYSCKYAGISNVKVATLIAATQKLDLGGISRRTFERMLVKAKELGIVSVHNTYSGRNQRHNVYVFNRYKLVETVQEQPKLVETVQNENVVPMTNDAPIKETGTSESNNHLNIRKDNVIPNVPIRFQELAKSYYSPKQVLELWKCVKNSTQYLTHYSDQDKNDIGVSSFKQMIVNIKLGYNVKNIFGYFYGVLQKKLDDEYEEMLSK